MTDNKYFIYTLKHPACPTADFNCPYYDEETFRCMMFDEEGVPPYEECDAFYEEDGFDEFESGKFIYDEFSANP